MRILYAIATLVFLCSAATAQGIGDGYWSFDGDVAHLEVTDIQNQNPHSVTVTDSSGFSSAVNGTPASGSGNVAKVTSSDTASTPGAEYDVKTVNGKTQLYKKDGKSWKPGKKVKKPKGSAGDMLRLHVGDPIPGPGTLYGDGGGIYSVTAGDTAHEDGYFSPGDEVVSIP